MCRSGAGWVTPPGHGQLVCPCQSVNQFIANPGEHFVSLEAGHFAIAIVSSHALRTFALSAGSFTSDYPATLPKSPPPASTSIPSGPTPAPRLPCLISTAHPPPTSQPP